jgi:hypothetical protein
VNAIFCAQGALLSWITFIFIHAVSLLPRFCGSITSLRKKTIADDYFAAVNMLVFNQFRLREDVKSSLVRLGGFEMTSHTNKSLLKRR